MPLEAAKALSPSDVESIHQTSMRILSDIGIEFPDPAALECFKDHGFQVQEQVVSFREDQLLEAISRAPSQFTIYGRDPKRSVTIGSGSTVMAPGYGAPFLADEQRGPQKPTLEDYQGIVRLAHELPNQDMTGFLLVMPDDLPAHEAYLHMIKAHLVHSDKPFLGCVEGEAGATHSLNMTAIVFKRSTEELAERPAMLALINTLSPLRFSQEMVQALMAYARAGQPVMVAAAAMAGSTAPISLAGMLAQQNAEILAGLTLVQLISPGNPVVYGSTSTNMDMKTGAMAIGSPELSLNISATAQMGKRYGLPCRSGGALTDSHSLDIRAGYESMCGLLAAITNGVDLMLHSAGIMSSFLMFSREKFLLDDEICGMLRHLLQGFSTEQEDLAFESIHSVDHTGNYLKDPKTLAECRTAFWQPRVYDRSGLREWVNLDRPLLSEIAREHWKEILAQHEDPALDADLINQLDRYIEEHKQDFIL